MIKTHKPRGHFWTCASTFQQSKEIRNFKFEDCLPADAPVLDPDSGPPPRPGEQAAKRRRIERLVHNFLDGEVPIIESAAMDARILKATIEWNTRSRTGKKFVIPDVDFSDDVPELWVDVHDPLEPYRNRIGGKQISSNPRGFPVRPEMNGVTLDVQVVEKEEASSACNQTRPMRLAKTSVTLSLDEMNQAAPLQEWRLNRATRENSLAAGVAEEASLDPSPFSETTAISQPRYLRNMKPSGTEWLTRRQILLCELNADEGIDERSRSSIKTPSRHSQSQNPRDRARSSLSTSLGRILSSSGCDMLKSGGCSGRDIGNAKVSMDVTDEDEVTATVKPPYLTAPERTDFETPGKPSPRESRRNLGPPNLQQQQSMPPASDTLSSPGEDKRPAAKCRAAGTSTSVSPQDVAQGLPLTTCAAPRVNVGRPRYTAIQSTDKDETPFAFRKRNHKAQIIGAQKRPSAKPRGATHLRKMAPSSNEPQNHCNLEIYGREQIAHGRSMLDIHLSNKSSFGMQLNMALVDEHLNTVLPVQPGSMRRSSALKMAIREEMKDAGAEISHIEGEAPTSSADLPEAMAMFSDEITSCSVRECLTEEGQRDLCQAKGIGRHIDDPATQWPGTQLALFQAQRDLYPFPEKRNRCDELTVTDRAPRQSTIDAVSPQVKVQRPSLQQLSQDHLPETQAIIDGWSPWSALKRPLAIARPAAAACSSAERSNRQQRMISRQSLPRSESPALDEGYSIRQRSSLRFSTSTADTASTVINFPVSKPISSLKQEKNFYRQDGTPRSAIRYSAQNDLCTPSKATELYIPATLVDQESKNGHNNDSVSARSLTSSPAGQTQLFRYDSNVDQTVTN